MQDQINDLGGVSEPVEVKLFGPDHAKLRELAEQVGKIVEKAGAVDVNANVQLGNPDIVIRREMRADGAGRPDGQDVENQLHAALYGQVASTLPEQDRITNIRVRYPDRGPLRSRAAGPTADQSARPRPRRVKRVCRRRRCPSASSRSARSPSIDLVRSPNELWRENQQPVITVTAELGDRDLGTVNRELADRPGRTSSSRPATAGSWPATTAPSRNRSPAC